MCFWALHAWYRIVLLGIVCKAIYSWKAATMTFVKQQSGRKPDRQQCKCRTGSVGEDSARDYVMGRGRQNGGPYDNQGTPGLHSANLVLSVVSAVTSLVQMHSCFVSSIHVMHLVSIPVSCWLTNSGPGLSKSSVAFITALTSNDGSSIWSHKLFICVHLRSITLQWHADCGVAPSA